MLPPWQQMVSDRRQVCRRCW